MAEQIVCLERHVKRPGESKIYYVDVSRILASGESLNAAPTTVTFTPSGLTVSGSGYTGNYWYARIAGGTANTQYTGVWVGGSSVASNVHEVVTLMTVRST